jgi:hypothetical protein
MRHPNDRHEAPYSIWTDKQKGLRCATSTPELHMPVACPSMGMNHVEISRHRPGRRCRNGTTMTKVCRVNHDPFSSTSEAIAMLCCNLGLIFTGAYTDAEEV